VANRLLRRVRDFADVRGAGVITGEIATEALGMLEVDEAGLDRADRALLEMIGSKFSGGPVGLSTLAAALDEEPSDLRSALVRYEALRRPVVEKLVAASKASAAWYERFPEHMRLAPLDFVHSYVTRSGRVDDERLRAMSPRFMARYDAARRPARAG
jgi:hypothetical protein